MDTFEQKKALYIVGWVIVLASIGISLFTHKDAIMFVGAAIGAALAIVAKMMLLQQNRQAVDALVEELAKNPLYSVDDMSAALNPSDGEDPTEEAGPEPAKSLPLEGGSAETNQTQVSALQVEAPKPSGEVTTDSLPPPFADAPTGSIRFDQGASPLAPVQIPISDTEPLEVPAQLYASEGFSGAPDFQGTVPPAVAPVDPPPFPQGALPVSGLPSAPVPAATGRASYSAQRTLNVVVAAMIGVAAIILGLSGAASYQALSLARQNSADEGAVPAPNQARSVQYGPIYDAESVQLPSGVPDCPKPAVMLAWGETEDGWFLVCGVSQHQPQEVFALLPPSAAGFTSAPPAPGGGYQVSTAKVNYSESLDGYTAELPSGTIIWLSAVNGVMGFSDETGSAVEQAQLVRYYFVNLTPGSDGQRQGAYGVVTPKNTAEDQVRYLSEIIARSEEARAALGPAVDRIYDCDFSQISTDIDTIRGVRDNRSELISALAATPVDKIPGGTRLVNQLTAALRASHDADVGYLEWAENVQRYGCGHPGGEVGDQHSGRAQILKQEFSDNWNANIAPVYNVPTVSKKTL